MVLRERKSFPVIVRDNAQFRRVISFELFKHQLRNRRQFFSFQYESSRRALLSFVLPTLGHDLTRLCGKQN